MAFSKRERFIGIATAAVVGVLALDRLAVTPLLAQRAQLELDRANRVFSTSRLASRKWKELSGTSLKTDASEAESQILNSVREWAQDAGIALSSIKPERAEKEKDWDKITFRATGTGSMNQVARFLWRLRTATMPVRITDLQIGSRKEGTDDLSLQLGISTIFLPPDANKPGGGSSTGGGGGSNAAAGRGGQS